MTNSELNARAEMVKYSHLVHRERLVTATDGNLSIRLDDKRILITPSSLRKEDMTLEAPVVIDYGGEVISGDRRASSEKKIHLKVYQERDDVHAVIHAHPTYSIALTVAGAPLDTCLLPEIVVSLGAVPVAPYATPSTEDLPASIEPFVKRSDVIMLERHGSLTMGKDLGTAFKLLEKLEQAAQISYLAMAIGGPVQFPPEELERLRGLRDFYGIKTQQVACSLSPTGQCANALRAAESTAGAESTSNSKASANAPGGDSGVASLSGEDIERLIAAITERVAAELDL